MAPKETIKVDSSFKGMVGHRGGASLETENTLKAFKAGGKRSYYGLECDVHASKDHVICISHDESLSRVGGIEMRIPAYNYSEIRKIKFVDITTGKVSDECFAPLLTEYLDICKESKKHPVIELKESLGVEDLLEVLKEVEEKGLMDEVVFISFYPGYLTKVREMYPNVKMQFLSQMYTDGILDLCVQYNMGIDILETVLTKEIIDKYHKNNLVVNCYTVNDKARALELIGWGIDYITSNILE